MTDEVDRQIRPSVQSSDRLNFEVIILQKKVHIILTVSGGESQFGAALFDRVGTPHTHELHQIHLLAEYNKVIGFILICTGPVTAQKEGVTKEIGMGVHAPARHMRPWGYMDGRRHT